MYKENNDIALTGFSDLSNTHCRITEKISSHHRMVLFVLLMGSILLTSSVARADDTVETCANGAGTVKVGAVSGDKYCRSNKSMNWWNAMAWCDGMGKQLIDLNTDCYRNGTTSRWNCPEMVGCVSGWIWTRTPSGSKIVLIDSSGNTGYASEKIFANAGSDILALCK